MTQEASSWLTGALVFPGGAWLIFPWTPGSASFSPQWCCDWTHMTAGRVVLGTEMATSITKPCISFICSALPTNAFTPGLQALQWWVVVQHRPEDPQIPLVSWAMPIPLLIENLKTKKTLFYCKNKNFGRLDICTNFNPFSGNTLDWNKPTEQGARLWGPQWWWTTRISRFWFVSVPTQPCSFSDGLPRMHLRLPSPANKRRVWL